MLKKFKFTIFTSMYFAICALSWFLISYSDYFFFLIFMLTPLSYLTKPFEIILKPMGLWQAAGPGGWMSNDLPNLQGFIVIGIVYLIISLILDYILLTRKQNK